MRSSLVWLLVGASSVGACVVGNFGGVPASAQEAPQARPSDVSDETIKDVEVMRRVLVREGLATRSSANVVTADRIDFYVTNGWGGVSASEAFVVPGQGATFVLRTSDSVAPPKGGDDAAAASPEKPSAWDEEAAALDGKPVTTRAARRANRYEAAKVDALRTRVLDVLAKYGQKVRGLAPNDRLTVIVVGSSGGGGTVVEPQTVSSNDEQARLVYRSVLALSGRSSDGRTVLVMSASVADCQAAASGTLAGDEFRRRASVSAY